FHKSYIVESYFMRVLFFFSSRRRHTISKRDWSSDVCSSDLVSHLTYIGDSDVGKYCNFGCGTVTCNYDGQNKYRTTIGDYCFIGCNTNLVAPVAVGDGAYTAAGSTVTQDVPAGALAIERGRQANVEGWAVPRMEAYIAKKQRLEAEQAGQD